MQAEAPVAPSGSTYETVKVERETNGITWVTLNRPEKRNAMNPTMHREMVAVLDELEFDDQTRVVVLTGAGESFCAGQDLKEYFRELDNSPRAKRQAQRDSQEWRWYKLYTFAKPTIAMVNGHCFGGAFTPLIACDFAIAAEDATFGLSEVNWGVFPGGLVSRALVHGLGQRDALYYIMTGEPFDGRRAAEMKLVNFAVPRAELRDETVKLASKLLDKNPRVLSAAKIVYKTAETMDYWQAEEYMQAKSIALRATDPEKGREKGMQQFLEDKKFRPGLGAYNRES